MDKDQMDLRDRVIRLETKLENMEKVLDTQTGMLEDLKDLAARGKGSLWMFITLGGVIGAIISNLKLISSLFRG